MGFSLAVKEKLAQIIGNYFTTNEILAVFKDTNIPIDTTLSAKWRMVLDAFSTIATPHESIPKIIEAFSHPLKFNDPEPRENFIRELNEVLSYENLEIKATDRTAEVVSSKDGVPTSYSYTKTAIDYVNEALNFFRIEYNKVKLTGLTYEYSLGENASSDQFENSRDEYDVRLGAIQRLKDADFITDYTIEVRIEDDGLYTWDYAVCKINESMLTQKEAPRATPEAVEFLTEKIIHEHTHKFENSIQEKEINLNHKIIDDGVKAATKPKNKIDLAKTTIDYDDNKAIIKIDEMIVRLPSYKNEHYFCRAMFQYSAKESVDWSMIYNEVAGEESREIERNKRMIKDAMYAVNNRIKELCNTDDNLFEFRDKSITRNF